MVRTVSVDDQEFGRTPRDCGLSSSSLPTKSNWELHVQGGDREKWHRHNVDVEDIYYTITGKG